MLVLQCSILLLGVVWACEWGWKAPFQNLRLTLFDGVLGLFLFWTIFSFLFAPYQHAASGAMLRIVCAAILYLWLVFHPSLKGLRWSLAAVTAQGLFQTALVVYQWWWLGTGRPGGTFYNPNFASGFLAAAIFLTLGWMYTPSSPLSRQGGARALSVAIVSLMAVGMVLTGSRGGMLALAFGSMVLIAGRNILYILLPAGAGLTGLVVSPNPWIERIVNLSQTDVFAYSRLSIWKSALEIMKEYPLFGIGLGQYKYYSPRFAFPVESHWARYSRVAETPHSEYLQVGAEMGVTGLVIFLTGIACLVVSSRTLLRNRSAEDRWRIAPLLAALSAVLVHAAVDFPLQIPPITLLLILAAAGLRLQGAEGPSWSFEFCFRKVYGVILSVGFVLLMVLALRPVVGFWYFLGGVGSPRNLLREKWSLEEAPRRPVPTVESIALLEKAVAADPRNATYHNVLGGRYFQSIIDGAREEDLRRKALYHAHYAAQLNPGNHRYLVSLGQAMESLAGHLGERPLLREAVGYYRQAAGLAPRFYAIHKKIGLLLEDLGQLQEAEGHLREVVRLEPHYLRGWFILGTFLARQGRIEEAREAYLRGRRSESLKLVNKAMTPYEHTLVDFDAGLFENRLKEIEKMGFRKE
jgi:O-antigen ligase